MRRSALFVLVALLGALAGPALASPSQEFDEAVAAFRSGDCGTAEELLSSLLYPQSQLADPAELAEAHLLLGACHLEEKRPLQAEREFEAALLLDPSLEANEILFSKAVVEVFRKKKEEFERRKKEEERLAEIAEERDRLKRVIENLVVVEKRRYWVNFVPFGAGQFQNGDTKKAIFFLSSQAILGGASVGLWSYQVIQYGFSGTVPPDEIGDVNRIRVAQITTGVAFFALLGWGIADSLANYEHSVSRKPDRTILEELELEEGRQQDEQGSSLRFYPAGGPDWAGVGLSWEF